MSEDDRKIVGNFDVTLNLTDKRGIKMTGYVYSDDTPEEVNARVDSFQDVLDRQMVRCDMLNKEAEVASSTVGLENYREHMQGLVDLQKTGKKLTSQDKAMIAKYDLESRSWIKRIQSAQAAIEAAKRKLNGAASA
jgi:hypothetical protein